MLQEIQLGQMWSPDYEQEFFGDKKVFNRTHIPWLHPHELKIIQNNWPDKIDFYCWTGTGGENGDCDSFAVAIFRIKNRRLSDEVIREYVSKFSEERSNHGIGAVYAPVITVKEGKLTSYLSCAQVFGYSCLDLRGYFTREEIFQGLRKIRWPNECFEVIPEVCKPKKKKRFLGFSYTVKL